MPGMSPVAPGGLSPAHQVPTPPQAQTPPRGQPIAPTPAPRVPTPPQGTPAQAPRVPPIAAPVAPTPAPKVPPSTAPAPVVAPAPAPKATPIAAVPQAPKPAPVLPPTAAPAETFWSVAKDTMIPQGGRAHYLLRAGKIISSRQYPIADLQAMGVPLVSVASRVVIPRAIILPD